MLYIRDLQHFSDENWGISVKTGEESIQNLSSAWRLYELDHWKRSVCSKVERLLCSCSWRVGSELCTHLKNNSEESEFPFRRVACAKCWCADGRVCVNRSRQAVQNILKSCLPLSSCASSLSCVKNSSFELRRSPAESGEESSTDNYNNYYNSCVHQRGNHRPAAISNWM